MTVEDLLLRVGGNPGALIGALALAPATAGLLALLLPRRRGAGSPWRYLLSLLVYAACVPGMFAVVLTLYALFFRNANLLQVDLLVYVLPIVSMVATLALARRTVASFDEVPGFRRLSGLMLILGVSMGIAFALHRAHVGVFFLGPIGSLAAVAAVAFALLSLGARRFAGKDDGKSIHDLIRESRDRKP